jgi:DNA-binding NtrC family response regulator
MTRKAVLVADGDDDTRSTYATALRHGGFVTLEARTVSEALGLIAWHRPAAVISGRTPVAGTCDLLECLRQHPLTAEMPVITVKPEVDPDGWVFATNHGLSRTVGPRSVLLARYAPL